MSISIQKKTLRKSSPTLQNQRERKTNRVKYSKDRIKIGAQDGSQNVVAHRLKKKLFKNIKLMISCCSYSRKVNVIQLSFKYNECDRN